MRIERLDILRYRALGDVRLDFRPDAKLHLVYGPQEAGKSTALAAVADALFGMPRALQPNAVRFPAGELRIGMRLRNGEETLAFRRRKADRDTLLSEDESGTLPDHVLAPFLAGTDRAAFNSVFGLTSASLRRAGEELAAMGGEAGAALLSASSGLSGLSALAGELDGEADALFGRRKADRLFWQIAGEHDAAQADERAAQLTDRDWKALRDALEADEAREEELKVERGDLRRRVARLQALIGAAPVHARALALQERLDAFDEFAAVPEGTADRLERLAQAAHGADTDESDALEAVEEAHESLSRVLFEERHLVHAASVHALTLRTGEIGKTMADLPRRQTELNERERDLERLAKDLGLGAADLASRQPTVAVLAELRALVRKGRALEAEADALARHDEDGEGDGTAVSDLAPLRARWRALAGTIASVAALPERKRELADLRRTASEDAARLRPSVPDLDAAAAWSLPDEAALERLGTRIDTARTAKDAATANLERLGNALRALEAEIARDRAAEIVTRDQIRNARARRDAALERGEDAMALVREADALADRAFAAAEQVALAEQRIHERDRKVAEHEEAERAGAAAADALGAARAALCEAFPVEIEEAGAPAMLRWTGRVNVLRDRWRDAGRQHDVVVALEREADELRAPFAATAQALGLDVSDMPVSAAAALIEDALDLAEAEARERADRRAVREARDKERAAVAERLLRWREAMDAAAPTIAVAAGSGLDALEAALDAWSRVPDVLEAAERLRHRVDRMEEDVATFAGDVGTVVAAMEPALADLAPEVAVSRMAELCDGAGRAAAEKRDWEQAAAERERTLERAARRALDARAASDEANAQLQGADAVAFDEALTRLRERDGLLRSLRREHDVLSGHLGGAGGEVSADDLEGFDAVAEALHLERLLDDDAALEAEARAVHTRIANARARVTALEEAGGSEEHAFRRNAAASRMADVGRRWLVLRAARLILDDATARVRDAEIGPWLERASAIFADLTDRSFERIEQDYSTGGTARLVGVRQGSEERVDAQGMSEGTRDQLYLALRLAHLTERGAAAGAMPFIGDDIFMTFDRPRTRAGLRALATIAPAVQPILFTHHDFVVEEARDVLGPALDVVDLRSGASRPVEELAVG